MKTNHFIWADLSTFDLAKAQHFYQNVFGWTYQQSDDNYYTAYSEVMATSGLYKMPEKFTQMNMPSFWMSYIQVNDVNTIVEKAKVCNGIVELVEDLYDFGKIALIRDPSGAGFTVYDGTRLNAKTQDQPNTMVWNELFVSNANLVIPFYQELFNWHIDYLNHDRYLVKDTNGNTITAIQQIDNSIKGKHEYWGVFFKVKDVNKVKQKIVAHNGKIIYEDSSFVLCTDHNDAMFHLMK